MAQYPVCLIISGISVVKFPDVWEKKYSQKVNFYSFLTKILPNNVNVFYTNISSFLIA